MPTNQQCLEELKKKFLLGKVSQSAYYQEKWKIIQDSISRQELLNPIFNDDVQWEIKDSKDSIFRYLSPGPFAHGDTNEYCELSSGIYIGKYPVTLKEFMLFLKDSGWEYPENEKFTMNQISQHEDSQVSNVSWLDAQEYCRWMRRYTNDYYSLPHEIEWEYAARGIDGRIHPWAHQRIERGSDPLRTNLKEDPNFTKGNLANKLSPFGCFGMVGNLSEWCVDEVEPDKDSRILRGGPWLNDTECVTCLNRRICSSSKERILSAGFRMVYLPESMYEDYQKEIRNTDSKIISKLGFKRIKNPSSYS